MAGDLFGARDDSVNLVANALQASAPLRWQGIEVLVDGVAQAGSAPLQSVGDLAAGMPKGGEFFLSQCIDEVASHAHHVVWRGLNEAIPAVIG